MYDLQLIAVQDDLPVLFVDYDLGMPVPTLILRGKDFHSASEVLVNGVKAPEIVILSASDMLAQVPDSQTGARIRSLQVLSNTFTATRRSRIRFRIASTGKGVSGIQRLVQKFCRFFFTAAGSDIFNKSGGASALDIIGSPTSKYSNSSVTAAFALAVDTAADQIINTQNQVSGLPADEKLASADLETVDYSYQLGAVAGRVHLVSVAGEDALLNLFPNE